MKREIYMLKESVSLHCANSRTSEGRGTLEMPNAFGNLRRDSLGLDRSLVGTFESLR